MLYLLSPAKSLDYESPVPAAVQAMASRPLFVDEASALIEVLRVKTPAEIATLMDLSDALAQLNVARYGAWRPRFSAANSRPAALAFNGDVYEGLQAGSLAAEDWAWAQQHLAILSGLYGVLRPLDRLQPYRLEMGTRLATPRGKDLYAFWGDTVAEHLNQRLAADDNSVLVNLASQEYFKVASRKVLKPRVVECVFEEAKAGGWKIVSFYAKRARGLMARYAIDQRIDRVADLRAFNAEGYAYTAAVSSPERLVFRRATPA